MEQRARILLVEDDPETVRVLTRYLAERYDVDVATDGEAGLAILLQPPPPDLLITDVMMPKMDGLEMVKQMRAKVTQRRPPVIFLTARDRPLDQIAGIQAGARHYLTKPVRLDDLEQKIKRSLGR